MIEFNFNMIEKKIIYEFDQLRSYKIIRLNKKRTEEKKRAHINTHILRTHTPAIQRSTLGSSAQLSIKSLHVIHWLLE